MRSIISTLLVAPIIGSFAAPSVERLHPFNQVDWETELLGRSDDNDLEKRARTEKSIDAIFKGLGKLYFGTCADAGSLGHADNAAVIQADFGQVTPENRYAYLSNRDEVKY
jgi:endo-1,4-beta-xylanase